MTIEFPAEAASYAKMFPFDDAIMPTWFRFYPTHKVKAYGSWQEQKTALIRERQRPLN